jgi:hypothetical protein
MVATTSSILDACNEARSGTKTFASIESPTYATEKLGETVGAVCLSPTPTDITFQVNFFPDFVHFKTTKFTVFV